MCYNTIKNEISGEIVERLQFKTIKNSIGLKIQYLDEGGNFLNIYIKK